MTFQPADSLKSRTFLGLIVAQFLAAFNDQAIHIVAIFYGTDMLARYVSLPHVDEKVVISVVTACFISPFFLFSPLAGMLADRYSKRATLIFWKLAEVAMMGLALVGFLLPHLSGLTGLAPTTLATWSAILVIAAVFLMGTHSAFFVPAKYGVMPEILLPSVLSRGNGYLEGTSFTAQILGTASGGFLYGLLKSTIGEQGGAKVLEPGWEWIIGLGLFVLAVVGAGASFAIARMPPAAPHRPLTWKLWQPLRANLGMLLNSRPLALAVLGIAFFAFMTLYLRQTLLYEGETAKELQVARQWQASQGTSLSAADEDELQDLGLSVPQASHAQQAELKVALLVALVGLGIGVGSPLAGYLSGSKVELGLIPIGASLLILLTAALAVFIQTTTGTVICLVLTGIAAGFYILPLYTLLQHRAPKDSKGNLVATSNFVNVAGGLVAVLVFYLVTFSLEKFFGLTLREEQVRQNLQLLPEYIRELEMQARLPSALFVTASLLTVGMVGLLCWQLPDLPLRTYLWLRSLGRYRLQLVGVHNLPSSGAVLLASNSADLEEALQVLAATDRLTLLWRPMPDKPLPWPLRWLARRSLVSANEQAAQRIAQLLRDDRILCLPVTSNGLDLDQVLTVLRAQTPVSILPLYRNEVAPPPDGSRRRVRVVIGRPMRPDATAAQIRHALGVLEDWLADIDRRGGTPSTVLIPEVSAASPTTPATSLPARP